MFSTLGTASSGLQLTDQEYVDCCRFSYQDRHMLTKTPVASRGKSYKSYQDYRMFLCLACRRYDSMWLALDPYFERVVTRRMFLAFVRSSTAPGMLRLNMWGSVNNVHGLSQKRNARST